MKAIHRFPGVWRQWPLFAAACGLVSALVLAGCGPSAEDQYPTRPVELVVAFTPGGVSDLGGRAIAEYLSTKWGKTINVVNKPGGGGATGAVYALQATPDGHTMLLHSVTHTRIAATQADAPYKWDDVEPVALVVRAGGAFIVHPDSPWKTLKDALEAIKARPEAYKYSAGAVVSEPAMGAAKLIKSLGVQPSRVAVVVFEGGGPSVAAVAGGHVDFASPNITDMVSLVKAGKLRALAVTTPERWPELPDVPTSKEAGYPQYDQMSWNGISAPLKVPAAIIKKWSDSLKAASEDPGFVDKMKKIGYIVTYKDPKEFKALMEEEFQSSRALAAELGMRK